MTTRMIHPLHGAMHAYSQGEIDNLRKLGWAPESGKVLEVVTTDAAEAKPVVAEEEAPAERRKPGRPPKAK